MRKESGVQNVVIVVLAITVLVMSVGFALYSQTLTVTGTTTFKKQTWDVRFDEAVKSTSGITPSALSVSGTTASFTAVFEKPGDTFTLNLSPKNYGTINAKLTGITITGPTSEQQEYVVYKVTYAGTEYTASQTGLNIPLNANDSHNVVIYAEYKLPDEATDLPTTDQAITLTATFTYADALT